VMSVAGLGANAAAQTGQAAMQNAQMGSNAYLNNAQMGSNSLANMGDAQAAGIIGGANAWSNTLGDLSGLFGYQSSIWDGKPASQPASQPATPSYTPMPMTPMAPTPTYAPPPVYNSYAPPYMGAPGSGPF